MTRCNVEFFDYQMNYVHHDTIEIPDIDDDYLTPEASSFLISQTADIPERGIIYVSEPIHFIGIIDSLQDESYQTRVSFKPFLSYFNQDVLFDIRLQKKAATYPSLEQTLGNLIEEYWGTNGSYRYNTVTINRPQDDALQRININVLPPITTTSNWDLGIVADQQGSSHTVVNFYETILESCLHRYRVVIEPIINLKEKRVDLSIGITDGEFKIDADLFGVKIKAFAINKLSSNVNKVEFWNLLDLQDRTRRNTTTPIYYYLHQDGTYDTDGTANRITPVILQVEIIDPGEEDGVPITFAAACRSRAEEIFADISWSNYIELEFGNYDRTVNPKTLRTGQLVKIYHNGEWFDTILTGKKLSTATTLIFGTMRVDMTKKAKLENSKR